MNNVESKINRQIHIEIGKAQKRIRNVMDELHQVQVSFKEKKAEIEWVEDVDEDSQTDQEWEELPAEAAKEDNKLGIFEELEAKVNIQVDF